MKGLFVIGTDTGVGKTWVASGLARLLSNRGVKVGVLKPAASGCGPERKGRFSSGDGRSLCEAARLGPEWEDLVVPIRYRRPLSPWVAGWTEGPADLGRVEKARGCLGSSFDFLVVEGVGGLHVPLTKEVWISHLAKRWKYPVLVVARAGLGTLNHTLLTLEALRVRKIPVWGVLVNGAKGKDLSEGSNLEALRRLARVPVFGPMAWDPRLRKDWDGVARRLETLKVLPRKAVPR